MNKIGKYEIVEELGRGGMGVVYKAYDALMEREVAIKVISEMMGAVEEVKSRFFREARTAGKLSHDNVTVIYEVGEDNGRPFIVMEYLAGNDLAELLERGDPISFQQKIDYAAQICRGLSFSHSKGIIHRDIKPGNIRIVAGGKVKIMDFGIAKPESSNLTRTGAMIGTPFYMSPEQVQGKKIDKRSDQFSFGILFYELLTGRKPFTGDEPTSVMYKIVFEEPEWVDSTLIDRTGGLQELVKKCLAKDPGKRFEDLSEVADILDGILADLKSGDRKKAEQLRLKVEKLIAESRTLLTGKKFKKALEVAEQAARLDPPNTGIARLSAEIKKAEEEETKRLFIEDRLASARKAFASKTYVKAQVFLQEILSVEPAHPEALRMNREAMDAIAYANTQDPRFARTQMAEPLPPPPAPPVHARVKTPTPKPVVVPKPATVMPREPTSSPGRKKIYVIAATVLLLIGAGLFYRLVLYVPPVPHGYVSLNILPWAQVTKIVSEGGNEIPLGELTVTPCRIALPEGSYQIHLANPYFGTPFVATVKIRNDETQEVKEKFSGYDYQQLLTKYQ